jgi:hypothetical protein
LSSSKWLKEYHSRIVEEYKFSIERKDKVLDWSIGILFVALVGYVELLRYQIPSIWRIYLIVGLLCFIMRLFSNSCLAYAYLKKWRYLLDLIEKHWMNSEISLDLVKKEIEKYHYTPRTIEKRIYFIKHQLVGGFFLLFLLPFVLLLFEIHSNPQDLNIIIPVLFLVAYYVYESIIYATDQKRSMPSGNDVPPVSNATEQNNKMERRKERLDSLFEYALVLLGVLAAAEFQYFLAIEEKKIFPYALRVFTVPFTIMILFWLVKELFSDTLRSDGKMLLTEYCWDFWSFTLFYYLLVMSGGLQYGGLQIGVIFPFLLSILLIYSINWAYGRASPVETGDRSMHNYYKSARWLLVRWLVVFVGAYLLLLVIVFPWGSK